MLFKFEWKPFWLVTQRDPQNDWPATRNRVNYDVLAQAPLVQSAQKTKLRFGLVATLRFTAPMMGRQMGS